MCNDKKSQWEEKKIKETWNNGKKYWKMIRELLEEDLDIEEDTYVYTNEGVKVEIQACGKEYVTRWKEAVYQKEPKTDFSFWYGSENLTGLKEIMNDKLSKGNSGIMEFPPITCKELTEVIKQMKNGKAAGIDDIPAELMKHLIKNEKIRVYLVKCFNNAVLESVHKDWLTSKTTMIPKTKKPKILDHRPIAVTVNNSKIVCTILRTRIEEFLKESNNKFDNQFGFTAEGRVEHCHFILQYLANEVYDGPRRGCLYFAFIDFKKAYDSIDRKRLIEVLVKFNINPKIIDLIVQMYEGDSTIIKLGKLKERVEVTGGIRQGCSISTLLFKLVTFTMIEDLRKEVDRYKIGEFEDNSLWLADDATLIADSIPNLKKLLGTLKTTGEKIGLQINKEKTKVMKIRGPKMEDSMDDIEVVKETKYLGIKVGGRYRNIYGNENKDLFSRAETQVNMLLAKIKRSADKVIVGKAIWKLMAIPALLYGRAVVTTTKEQITKIQRLENKVWRCLLGIGGYSTVESLRGEIGASMVKTRIMQTVLLYARDTLNSKFENVRVIMKDVIENEKGKWYKMADGYRNELGITWEVLEKLEKSALKTLINHYDTNEWRIGMAGKVSLKYYIKEKSKVKYEYCYRNSTDSLFLARARTNSIKLEDHKGRGVEGYDRTCKMCKKTEENIVHFLINCEKLEAYRNYDLIDGNIQDSEERMRILLFRNNRFQETGEMIKNLWFKRKHLLGENKDKKKEKDKKIQKGQNPHRGKKVQQKHNLP